MIQGFVSQPDATASHNELHRKLFRLAFCILPDVTNTLPTTTTLQEGYGQIYQSTGNNIERRLYLNIYGTLTYVRLHGV